MVGKTGTPTGCDTTRLRRVHRAHGRDVGESCSVLAVQADGSEVTTTEGLGNGEWHPLRTAVREGHALQGGYCAPGMIMAAAGLLREPGAGAGVRRGGGRGAAVNRDELREAAAQAADGTGPPSGLNARPGGRQHLARVLAGPALAHAAGV